MTNETELAIIIVVMLLCGIPVLACILASLGQDR